jgi:hypothetical protein
MRAMRARGFKGYGDLELVNLPALSENLKDRRFDGVSVTERFPVHSAV